MVSIGNVAQKLKTGSLYISLKLVTYSAKSSVWFMEDGQLPVLILLFKLWQNTSPQCGKGWFYFGSQFEGSFCYSWWWQQAFGVAGCLVSFHPQPKGRKRWTLVFTGFFLSKFSSGGHRMAMVTLRACTPTSTNLTYRCPLGLPGRFSLRGWC